MNSIQPESQKIKKSKESYHTPRNFICGGCAKTYASYPALSFHIKKKHDGIMPSETKIHKSPKSKPPVSGRPQKARLSSAFLNFS